ncbi:MAG: Ku protein [Terriglobia bacterium]
MATTVWKGHLSFGLITIPIRLHAAARGERISFNQLHKECHARVRQPLYCPTCERMIERSETIKGYEYEKGQYVLVQEEELKKIAPPSASTLDILEFVKLTDVDAIYFDSSYYVLPEEAGRKAYHLLMQTMEEHSLVGIAKIVMHQREYTLILRPRANGLTLHTMFYPNEIRRVAEYGQRDGVKISAQEKKLAKQLVESLVTTFEPQKYHDEYYARAQALIKAKLEGHEVAATPERKLAPVIDLMDALKKSLAARETPVKKAPARAVAVVAAKRSRRRAGS